MKGEGLRIKWKPKSKAGYRTLQLPSWAVEMLRRRQAEAEPNEWNVVFTSPTGLLRDPSNTQADLRDVFTRMRFPRFPGRVGWVVVPSSILAVGSSLRKRVHVERPQRSEDERRGRSTSEGHADGR